MSVNVTIFKQEPLIVKGTTDIARGWKKNEKGFGYFGAGSLGYPGDRSLELTVNVRVRPYGFLDSFVQFPENLEVSGDLLWAGQPNFALFATRLGRAGFAIAVDALRPTLERDVDEYVRFDPVVLVSGTPRIQMTVSVRIRSSPLEKMGDVPEWDTQFFQGGLPGLGKKRP